MISYPLYFFRLIDRGAQNASGSAPRLPAAAAAAPTGPGMPQTHHVTGPGPPGAARESPKPPNGRILAHAICTAASAELRRPQNRRKSVVGAAGEGGGGGGDGGGDARRGGGAHGAVGGSPGAVGGT
jgi:hypothetical protein